MSQTASLLCYNKSSLPCIHFLTAVKLEVTSLIICNHNGILTSIRAVLKTILLSSEVVFYINAVWPLVKYLV